MSDAGVESINISNDSINTPLKPMKSPMDIGNKYKSQY